MKKIHPTKRKPFTSKYSKQQKWDLFSSYDIDIYLLDNLVHKILPQEKRET